MISRSSAVPTIYAKMVRLVPFQLYPPNITMTRRHLDRLSQSLVMCPNKFERHYGKQWFLAGLLSAISAVPTIWVTEDLLAISRNELERH